MSFILLTETIAKCWGIWRVGINFFLKKILPK